MKSENVLDRKNILNHGFIFRSDPELMGKIRDFILDSGVALIYQKHSFARLYIIEEKGSGSIEATNNHQ